MMIWIYLYHIFLHVSILQFFQLAMYQEITLKTLDSPQGCFLPVQNCVHPTPTMKIRSLQPAVVEPTHLKHMRTIKLDHFPKDREGKFSKYLKPPTREKKTMGVGTV